MTLAEKLAKAADILKQNPHFEHAATLSKTATTLATAVEAFLTKADESLLTSDPLFPQLAGLLANPKTKGMATISWANALLKRAGESALTTKSITKNNRDKFVVLLVKHHLAQEAIDYLSKTPEKLLQDEFSELAKLGASAALRAIDQKYPKAKLLPFCEANGIDVVKKNRSINREETFHRINKALEAFRARQSL